MDHPIDEKCKDQPCKLCAAPATHRVREVLPIPVPYAPLRNLPRAVCLCCRCFGELFGTCQEGG